MLAVNVTDLEDYSALLRLSRNLWKNEGVRGAAVMVGAGVSRSAILAADDIPVPPLWFDLQEAMASELYPADPKRAPSDPLRLAEEYRVYFGQNALDDFILKHIKDSSWEPAPLHQILLELPWCDVLTTNYDTILERASRSVNRSYEPVASPADLASTRAPRIVKLHGSIDTGGPFILAAEDYRLYPQTHGVFVNFARQTFIENDLCLLGFSGDDPNFLAWSGWVRDHLGSSARRIYLVGALNLGSAKRRYLISQNIVPIDLYPLVANSDPKLRHEAATKLFLQALRDLRPILRHEWQPGESSVKISIHQKPTEEEVKQLRACMAQWRIDRESYPGWLICPRSQRVTIRTAINSTTVSVSGLQALSKKEIIDFFMELIWRYRTAMGPLDPKIASWIFELTDIERMPQTLQREQAALALTLLHHARIHGDVAMFERLSNLIEGMPSFSGDEKAEFAHEKALFHCARFNLSAAFNLTSDIQGKDPIWALRKAAILAECGKLAKAEALVHETLKDLQRRERLNRNSLWIRSRLAYFEFVAARYRIDRCEDQVWDDRYRATYCDPMQEIDAIISTIRMAVRKSQLRLEVFFPRFAGGVSIAPAFNLISKSNISISPVDEFIEFLELTGIPHRLCFSTIFSDEWIDGLTLVGKRDVTWFLNLFRYLGTGQDALLDKHLSQIVIASLAMEDVTTITDALKHARDYWLQQIQNEVVDFDRFFAVDRLKTIFRILAQFVIRFPSDVACNIHIETLDQIRSNLLYIPSIFENLKLFLGNSYSAIMPKHRNKAVEKGIELPLPSELGDIDPLVWILCSDLRTISPSVHITALIDEWLIKMGEDKYRAPALRRINSMREAGLLSGRQKQIFSKQVWRHLDTGYPPLPQQNVLYPGSLIDVIKPDGTSPRHEIKERIFSPIRDHISQNKIFSILHAVEFKSLTPTPKQARELFDSLSIWRASKSLSHIIQSDIRQVIGRVLSEALSPSLAARDKTKGRVEVLWEFISEEADNAGLAALLPFLTTFPDRLDDIIRQLSKGFVSSNNKTIINNYYTIQKWVSAPQRIKKLLPQSIIERLVMMVEIQADLNMPMLLDTVRMMIQHGVVRPEQHNRLEAALHGLLSVMQYQSVTPESKLAVDISLIRRGAVLLCLTLKKQGATWDIIDNWLSAGNEDVLPEVRYCH